MAFVTDEIRNFVKDVSRGIVATVDRDGQPHVSVKKGRLRKDGSLELWNVFGEETVQNIEANPGVCVAFVNFEEATGYRFKGLGAIERAEERFEKVKGNLSGAGWVLNALIRVQVEGSPSSPRSLMKWIRRVLSRPCATDVTQNHLILRAS